MHPKKNRCITFWGGWKYRGLETNAMTLRHRLPNAGEFFVLIFLERLFPQMRKVEGSPAALARDWNPPKSKR